MITQTIGILCVISLIGSTLVGAATPSVQENPSISSSIDKLHGLDEIVNTTLETFNIPGIAVGIIIDGEVVLTKGYGVRDLENTLPVTENTLFAIGSCTKAFTTHVLGQLVDEGLISWDDKVIKHIPDFRLKDEYATYHITIRDLVTHQSGLPRHDLIWYGSHSSRTDLLSRLQHLESSADLRGKFQYNNVMYAIAGLVIERITGISWEEAVQLRILTPLRMNTTNLSVFDSQETEDFSLPFREKNGIVTPIAFRDIGAAGPAGSINSSAADMVKWLSLQLSDGTFNDHSFVKTGTLRTMHSPQVVLGSFPEEGSWFFGYGLGWCTGIHEGRYFVTHGGGIDGFTSSVGFLPKEKIGVVVLVNKDNTMIAGQLSEAILDKILGISKEDWLPKAKEQEDRLKAAKKEVQPAINTNLIRSLDEYLGEFENPGYGKIQIGKEENQLVLSYNTLQFKLTHKCYDHFSATFEEEVMNCAFVTDSTGTIVELHIPFEVSLKPIVFNKNPDNSLLAIDYLRQFERVFEGAIGSFAVALKGNQLIAELVGTPQSFTLIPEKPLHFSLKELPDSTASFTLGEDGKIDEMLFCTSNRTFTFKAK